MKKAAVSILLFLFLGNTVLFSQDGEEIDFLEKVAEPKKTASKKSSSSTSSSTKSSKKKEKKKSKKKKSKKSSTSPQNPENTKKNVEPSTNAEDPSKSGNNSQNNGSNSNSVNSSNTNSQTKDPSTRSVEEEQQLASASKVDTSDLQKPYWVNEEVKIKPNGLPGITVVAEPEKVEPGPSFQSRLSDILKLGEDKKKEEEKKKVQEGQKSGSFTGFISDYKKPIIIVVFILLFALYRLKAGKSRGSSGRRSPVTINKMRRD